LTAGNDLTGNTSQDRFSEIQARNMAASMRRKPDCPRSADELLTLLYIMCIIGT